MVQTAKVGSLIINDKCKALAKKVKELIDTQSCFCDWLSNTNVRAKLNQDLWFLLDENGYHLNGAMMFLIRFLTKWKTIKSINLPHAYIVLIQTIIRLWLQNRNRKILMNMITPSKEQSKRSAAHIFAAFQYQWDYFVLQLLDTNDDTITVSFELLDDVDKQTGECITLYQIKHSVQKNAKNETINLSNRDTDLWKTISIWMEFIDEQPDVLASHKFVLVTNKAIEDNAFVNALGKFRENRSIDELKSALISIQESERVNKDKTDITKKKSADISEIITKLLSKSYLSEFCARISVSETSDMLKDEVKRYMDNRFCLNKNRVEWVYDQLMNRLRDDSVENIENNIPISYTGAIFKERYQSIIDIGRQKIHFRTNYSFSEFNGNPRDLLFMKQLFSIGDTKEDELDRMVELTTRWLCFNNNLQEHFNNKALLHEDVDRLTKNVVSSWDNYHRSKHRRITSASTDDELCEAGCNTVDEMRKERFSLAETPLEQFLSEGCIYYYSNSPTDIIPELPLIGWHHNWKDKFKKS